MLIHEDVDAYETVVEHEPCFWHERYPRTSHPNCTCFTAVKRVRVSEEKRRANKRKRLEGEREHLKRRLAAVEGELERIEP